MLSLFIVFLIYLFIVLQSEFCVRMVINVIYINLIGEVNPVL